jgi:leucyl-tRNA synthetase
MMAYLNDVTADGYISKGEFRTLLLLLYPFTPHIAEEINEILGYKIPLFKSAYPKYDPSKLLDDEIEIPVQINGKFKGTVKVKNDADKEEVKAAVMKDETLSALLAAVKKEIYVPKKIINFIV